MRIQSTLCRIHLVALLVSALLTSLNVQNPPVLRQVKLILEECRFAAFFLGVSCFGRRGMLVSYEQTNNLKGHA